MERVAQSTSSGSGRFCRQSAGMPGGWLAAGVLLVMAAALPRIAAATVYIGGTPKTSIVAHSNYSFKPWVTAPDLKKVKFSISGKPYWATFDTTNGTLSGKVYEGNVGTYKNIRISATDGSSTSAMPVFAIAVVSEGSTPPPANPPPTNPPPTNPPPATAAGTLQLGAPSYSAAQDAGSLTVKVNRTAGSKGVVSATIATANGSALAGTDFTAGKSTLQWADGDTSTKNFLIALKSPAPYTGSKSFAVTLSAPSSGAKLGTPASAAVTITGTAAPTSPGKGAPAAVSNLQLINQGGPNNGGNPPKPLTNVQQLSWNAAAAGAKPISFYRIYRNGVAYATTTALTYTDTNATASNDPKWATPARIYAYNVAAVDTAGTEGPQASQVAVYVYRNGVSNWANYDLSWGNIKENYASTAGKPQGGPYDISVEFIQGGFQPTAHAPQAVQDDLEIGAFNYFTIDVNPGTVANYNFLSFGTVSRVPPGDIFGWHPPVNVFEYGPAPKANTWATYKVPLSAVGMGTCEFTGSITGNKLTVTGIVAGEPLVDAGGFVTGPGVPAGTYITAYGQASAIGTFTVAGPGISSSTRVSSTKMTYQRTSLYKFALFPDVGNTTIYFNNLGFTTSK